jgi:hypothetical protein
MQCYSKLTVLELDAIVEDFKKEFDTILGDTFDQSELDRYEKMIDALASIEAQEILEELTFDDLSSDTKLESEQRLHFEQSQSCLCFENLPYLETNPFQVSYLIKLLSRFDELLIDTGGVNELVFKDQFLKSLTDMKTMDGLVRQLSFKPRVIVKGPVDDLLDAIYSELNRIGGQSDLSSWAETLSPKVKALFDIVSTDQVDSETLLRKSQLNTKDFGDCLERLKFSLKKII